MNALRSAEQRIVWGGCILIARLLLVFSARVRLKFYGALPKGGFILATNHISHFDPPLLSISFPRPIDWIAIKELFHGPALRRLFSALSVIPVDRHGADRSALRTAAKRLSAAHVVGIFPEGGIRDGAKSIVNGAKMKGGAAMLSLLSGAPVVPGVILGSDRLYNKKNWLPWRRATVWIGFGEAVAPSGKLAGAQRRELLEERLADAFVHLRDRLEKDFHLRDVDLPQPPRERMREP